MLIIPHSGGFTEIGSNDVVAWKPVREAARAAFDVLPLLKDARKVKILHVSQRAHDPPEPGENPIGPAVSSHGIGWTARTSLRGVSAWRRDSVTCRRGSDRPPCPGSLWPWPQRELRFGGVMIHVARHMNARTLFSH